MDTSEQLKRAIDDLLGRTGWTSGKLARESQVPKATIDNWRRGRASRARAWQQIAQVAAAFELDNLETSQLFIAAGHPPLIELLEMHLPAADRALLERWARVTPRPASTGAQPTYEADADESSLLLPVKRIPAVAPPPAGSRTHFPRNPFFVGREHDLRAIARTLGGHDRPYDQTFNSVALTGMGGIGKTQLALEFAHRYGQYFQGGVFVLNFANPAAIPAEVAAVGNHTFLNTYPSFGSLSQEEQVRLVWSSWHDAVPRLLIFDGCEDERLFRQWRPASGNSRVLITSRRSQWDTLLGVLTLTVDTLERSESVQLLHRYLTGVDDSESFEAIAAEVVDLPLALHLAGTFLHRYRHLVSPSGYLDELRAAQHGVGAILDHPSFGEGAISPTDHIQNLRQTFEESAKALDETKLVDMLAITVLAHAATLAAGHPIPRDLLRTSVQRSTPRLFSAYAFEDAVTRLSNLGLVGISDGGALIVHRLMACYIAASTLIVNAQTHVEAALLDMIRPLNGADDIQAMRSLEPHLRQIADAAFERNDEQMVKLCEALGYVLWRINDVPAAARYIERACAVRPQHGDTPTANLTETLNLLGLIRQMQSRFGEARALFEQAVRYCESAPEVDQRSLAVALNNLGFLLYQQTDFNAAHTHLRHALALARQVFGLHDGNTARIINNLAKVYLAQNRVRRSERYHRLALAIRSALLPPTHLSLAQTLNDLGEVALARGDTQTADHLFGRALEIHEHLFGDHHSSAARSYYLRGRSLLDQGVLSEAYDMLEHAQSISTHLLGPSHHETALATGMMGLVRARQRRPDDARPLIERAIVTLRAIFGGHHIDEAAFLYHLGILHVNGGDYRAAYAELRQAYAIQHERLGDEHPTTVRSLSALKFARKHLKRT